MHLPPQRTPFGRGEVLLSWAQPVSVESDAGDSDREAHVVTLRRLIALVVLLAVAASGLESVVGMLRDGEVHHESLAAATVHKVASDGAHRHDDRQIPAERDGGERHDHNTAADHCTHQHSAATVPVIAFALPADTSSDILDDPLLSSEGHTTHLPHPPRA